MAAVVFLLFDGVHVLDVTGPAAVFAEANEALSKTAYDLVFASEHGGLVAAFGGPPLAALALHEAPERPDLVVVPGGVSADAMTPFVRSRAVRRWLNRAAPDRLASVCSGAFALAAWSYLDGRRATTHWSAASRLAESYPRVSVTDDALFVQEGQVWTSAGVSTGIDMALALVEQDHGREISIKVARRLVLQSRRSGHQSQYSELLTAQAGPYQPLVDWMADHLDEDLSVEALAEQAGQSWRTFHRRFTGAVGRTPAAFVERLRVEAGRKMLEAGLTPAVVARRVGLGTSGRLRRAFLGVLGISPAEYLKAHGPPDDPLR